MPNYRNANMRYDDALQHDMRTSILCGDWRMSLAISKQINFANPLGINDADFEGPIGIVESIMQSEPRMRNYKDLHADNQTLLHLFDASS